MRGYFAKSNEHGSATGHAIKHPAQGNTGVWLQHQPALPVLKGTQVPQQGHASLSSARSAQQ